METLQELLARSTALHHRLCPRQVLGVRMGLLAGKVLNIDLPQKDKRLFAFVECDGCGMGGIAAATGCWVERRTMRVLDYGKLAATFVDTRTGQAVRIKPHPGCREVAQRLLPGSPDSWHAMLEAYQVLPDEELLVVEPVELAVSLDAIISQPDLRVNCAACGEEITNGREVLRGEQALCRACAGEIYYTRKGTRTTAPGNPQRDELGAVPVITFIGRSGSGKTTLLEKLIHELAGRGYRIAAVKHHSHSNFEIDVPGKDSWRFAQAGSRQVIISAPERFASYRQLDHELSLDEISAGITGVDLILVEGYKQANKPAIEVVRAANSQDLVGTREQRIAIVSDLDWNLGVPRFELEDIHGIAGLIEERFNLRRSGSRVD